MLYLQPDSIKDLLYIIETVWMRELKKSNQFSIWTPVSPLHIMLTNVQKDKHYIIVNLTFDPVEIKCHHLIYPSQHLWEILYICNLLLNKLHVKKEYVFEITMTLTVCASGHVFETKAGITFPCTHHRHLVLIWFFYCCRVCV